MHLEGNGSKMENENIIKSNLVKDESELKKNCIRIIKGSIFAIILSLIFLLIFAMLLVYTSLSETTMFPVVTVITGISIFIGSTISTIKIRKNGLLNGSLVGLIYILLLYLASSICFAGFSLNINSIITICASVICGMIGGVVGVNLNKK